jgi:DivIVA domain-containing protein
MVLLGVLGVAAVAFLLASVGGGLPDAPPDSGDPALPADRPLHAADIPRLRFRIGVRGYRMADVDAALDALHEAMVALEERSSQPVAQEEA